jgi:hypothetical protein
MRFKSIAVVTSIIAFALGVGYILAGELVVGRWQIRVSGDVLLMGRRIGALYLGLSTMFFLARSAAASEARTALVCGTGIALSLLVLLGIYELMLGHVGAGILASMAVEAFLAVCYFWIFVADRRNVVAQK